MCSWAWLQLSHSVITGLVLLTEFLCLVHKQARRVVFIFPDTPAPLLMLGSHRPGGEGDGCVPHLLLAGEVCCVRSYSLLSHLVEPVCDAMCVSRDCPEGEVSLIDSCGWDIFGLFLSLKTRLSQIQVFLIYWQALFHQGLLFDNCWVYQCAGLAPTLYTLLFDPMNCSPPASSVCGISQARILEWVAISFPRVIHC